MESGLLPTTKHRRGRRTARQEAALASNSAFLLDPSDVPQLMTESTEPILDIGFGTGEAVVACAQAHQQTTIVAVDMHTPGIGDLLASIAELDLRNVYVVNADVRDLLTTWLPPACLAGARTFFPDPWPKKRHHRRRLIQRDFATLLADRVRIGGWWHIATDWPDYANHIEFALQPVRSWQGGAIDRPHDRPETRYERRGIAAGRSPIDLWFERVAP